MKVRLDVTKEGRPLYAGTYDIVDADSFGKACADAWSKLMQEQLRHNSNIGALMEHLESGVLDQFDGVCLHIERAL
jgi:hypothetical protein